MVVRNVKNKRIYIAGPISGVVNYKKNFERAERYLKDKGYIVLNPAILPEEGFTQEEYMRMCIPMLNTCEEVYMLNGWEKSKGAEIEHLLAKQACKKIHYEPMYDEHFKEIREKLGSAITIRKSKSKSKLDLFYGNTIEVDTDIIRDIFGIDERNLLETGVKEGLDDVWLFIVSAKRDIYGKNSGEFIIDKKYVNIKDKEY